jgi:hypothetical protein
VAAAVVAVVAAISLQDHTVAALLGAGMPVVATLDMLAVAILAVAILEVAIPAVLMPGVEWDGMLVGMARTGTAGIGADVITGTAAAVTGKIRMGDGDGGMGTNGVIHGLMWCSLATLAFPGGGVGAGVRGPAGAGIIRTGTDITATAILTTGTATHTTATEMDTARSTSTDSTEDGTETAANPELPSCSGDWHALVITTDPSMESSGQKRGGQSRLTSRSTAT